MRARRHTAFTLVELMIVVAIIGLVGSLAARLYSRGVRGEAAPSFARTLMSTMLEARHTALTLGRASRVTLTPGTPAMRVVTDQWDPSTSTWVTQGTVWVPSSLQLCQPDASVQLGSVSPACPITTSSTNIVCFAPNGRVNLVAANCPTTSPSNGTGATLYFSTTAGDKKYRLVVWGLTGMPKLIDQW